MMNTKIKEHKDVSDIKNSCAINPDDESTRAVCHSNHQESDPQLNEKTVPTDDTANPGNKHMNKNKKPQNMEKKGLHEHNKER